MISVKYEHQSIDASNCFFPLEDFGKVENVELLHVESVASTEYVFCIRNHRMFDKRFIPGWVPTALRDECAHENNNKVKIRLS